MPRPGVKPEVQRPNRCATKTGYIIYSIGCLGGAAVRALDFRPRGLVLIPDRGVMWTPTSTQPYILHWAGCARLC